jgi:hypothetical protein
MKNPNKAKLLRECRLVVDWAGGDKRGRMMESESYWTQSFFLWCGDKNVLVRL